MSISDLILVKMRRSRSRSGLIETAFVSTAAAATTTASNDNSGGHNNNPLSSYSSSHEDLDDVDRLANHPVLRSIRQVRRVDAYGHSSSLLRKSRSETGEVLLGGWGTFDRESVSSNGSPKNVSAASSSAGRVLGRRAMAQKLGMSRSATAAGPQEFFRTANPPPGSPVSSSGTVSSWVFQHHGNRSQNAYHHHHRHFHHHLNRNTCLNSKSAPSTPPTWSEVKIANAKRFSPVASTASPTESRKLEVNQQERQQEQLRGSPRLQVVQAVIENAVTPVTHRDFAVAPPDLAREESPKLTSDTPDTVPSNNTPPNTAPLSAKFTRLQQPPQNLLKTQLNRQGNNKVMVDSSEEGSVNDIQSVEEEDDLEDDMEAMPEVQEPTSKPSFVLSLKAKLSRRKDVVDNSSSAESTPQKLASAQIRRGATTTQQNTKMGIKAKFLSSGESSCSSAMSSLESVRSSSEHNNRMSCGNTTSNSEASSLATPPPRAATKSRPSLELGWGKRAAGTAKFQVSN